MKQKRERELFEAALRLDSKDRSDFLDLECTDNAALRERVARLLAAAEKYDPATAEMMMDTEWAEPSEQIGPYRILRPLGEGGMGAVFEAEQREPLRRRVALKIIKPGMDTKAVVARFEAERQALAVMDHANIASVFDGGMTETGRPYFVMELVRGLPLSEYCDGHGLSSRQRLEIFLQLCYAVHHAHQKGVIHRDLKPSNVLIAEQDGKAIPKVIDFGVAKAVGGRLTQHTLITHHGQAIGTPAYMSPEQAKITGLDVDTRTDIFSLGVILYELLVGRLPLDPKEIGVAEFVVQLARGETEAPIPSSKLAALHLTDQEAVAGIRQTDPASLRRQLKGDLDVIIMKAMERDRNRRYDSASSLARDIERFLREEPIEARPPTARYRMAKFLRRHRAGAAVAALLGLTVLAGIVGTSLGLRRARAAEAEALAEAHTSSEVIDFLIRIFRVSSPGESRGNSITAREILNRGVEDIGALTDEPEVQARLLGVMGEVHYSLGFYDQAEALFVQGLEAERSVHGESAEVAEALVRMGLLFHQREDYPKAERFYREALQMRRRLQDTDPIDLSSNLNNLGMLLFEAGDVEAGRPLVSEALELRRRHLPPNDPAIATALNNLARIYLSEGDFERAEKGYRESLAMRQAAFGSDHPAVTTSLNSVALVLTRRGKDREAEAIYRESLASQRRIYGDAHPALANTLNNLARVLTSRGALGEAEQMLREAIDIDRKTRGDQHPSFGVLLGSLAANLSQQQRHEEAEQLLRTSIDLYQATVGENHRRTANARTSLGGTLFRQDKIAEAEQEYRAALRYWREFEPPDHVLSSIAMVGLGRVLTSAGKHDEAELLLREALRIREAGYRENHPRIASSRSVLGDCLSAAGKFEEAESLLLASLETQQDVLGPDNSQTRATLSSLVRLYERWEKPSEAARYEALQR